MNANEVALMLSFDYDIFINGGSVLLLSHDLDMSAREGVLDSTLYMQLASAARHPALAEYEQWWQLYRSQLNQFGWARLQDFDGSFEPAPGQQYQTINQIIVPRVGRYLSSQYADVIDRALVELSRLPSDSAARELLRRYSVAEEQGLDLSRIRLQVGIVLVGARLIYLTCSFATREALPHTTIEHRFSTKDIVGDIDFNGCITVLDSTVYESWRKKIAAVVAPSRQALIQAV